MQIFFFFFLLKGKFENYPNDYHPYDLRFNTIYWGYNADFAIGISFKDPRSGEILVSRIFLSEEFISGKIYK